MDMLWCVILFIHICSIGSRGLNADQFHRRSDLSSLQPWRFQATTAPLTVRSQSPSKVAAKYIEGDTLLVANSADLANTIIRYSASTLGITFARFVIVDNTYL